MKRFEWQWWEWETRRRSEGWAEEGISSFLEFEKSPVSRSSRSCDLDPTFLDREVHEFKERGEKVATHRDLRRVFDDNSIDAVVIALPNHWHALATVWACQAGKDVYVEKPFSYNLWEGRQMVAAARKHGRMVQVGTQSRSSMLLRQAFDYLRGGQFGAIRYAHALVYRARDGIGTVDTPTPVPASVDYDLWCGPAAEGPLMCKQLNYEWHWFWGTGNGEMGNNGIHVIDVCRWALGQNQPPPRAMSIGGRFAFDDCGETANTQIALFDYQPAPLICEVRNVSRSRGNGSMGRFRNSNHGVVIDCEGGYFAGDSNGGAVFDHEGKKIKTFYTAVKPEGLETAHLSSFVSRRSQSKDQRPACEAPGGLSVCGLLPYGEHFSSARQTNLAGGHSRRGQRKFAAVGRIRAVPRLSA